MKLTRQEREEKRRLENLVDFVESRSGQQMKNDDPRLYEQMIREMQGYTEGGYKSCTLDKPVKPHIKVDRNK